MEAKTVYINGFGWLTAEEIKSKIDLLTEGLMDIIGDQDNDLKELNETLEEAESEISDLEDEVSDLEDQIEELESNINDMEEE